MSGFHFVVIEPVWETGVTPVKDSRFYDTPTGLLTTPSQDRRDPWNIVVVCLCSLRSKASVLTSLSRVDRYIIRRKGTPVFYPLSKSQWYNLTLVSGIGLLICEEL